MISADRRHRQILLALAIYVAIHSITLARFPLIHSDESWLAGLTRTMLAERSLSVTENFFALFPRFPHALRSLYHLVQMPFIALSYTPFMTRLPSLLAGLGALFLAYRVGKILLPRFSWAFPLLLSLDVQFWYAAHFGRQEIFMLLFLLLALERSVVPGGRFVYALQTGGALALAVGFHPNAFIIALGVGGFWAGRILCAGSGGERRGLLISTALLTGTVALGGLLFLALSLWMNPSFLSNYRSLGAGQGVSSSILIKLLELPRFFSKTWRSLSGTYYMPEVRPQLLLFAAAGIVSLPLLILRKARIRLLPFWGLLVGSVAGILLIGKYSPPSVLLLFAPGYLLLLVSADELLGNRRVLRTAALTLALLLALVTASEIVHAYRADYPALMDELEEQLPEEGRVLGNLNLAYGLEEGRLRDYRDLGYLREYKLSVADYLEQEAIGVVIITAELELINRERPVWNRMYGNPYYWYEELTMILEERGDLTADIPAPWYGVRLFHWMGRDESPIRIYRLGAEAP